MEQAVQFINEVGFPIAAALGLGFFIWKLINRIIDGMETKLDTLSLLRSRITPLSFIFDIASNNLKNSLLFVTSSCLFSII